MLSLTAWSSIDSIWGFKLNGRGSGTWFEVLGPTSIPFPYDIHGVSGGLSAYESTSAYHLGGFASWETSQYYPKEEGRVLPSGLLKFNFSTLEMTNSSDYQPISNGAMFNIPSYNDNDLLIVLPVGLFLWVSLSTMSLCMTRKMKSGIFKPLQVIFLNTGVPFVQLQIKKKGVLILKCKSETECYIRQKN